MILTLTFNNKKTIMEETKKCPYCGEEILAAARKCKHCGEWLEEKPADPANPTQTTATQEAGTATPPPAPLTDVNVTAGNVPGLIGRYYVEVFFRHYADFNGKLPLRQFWMAYLFYVVSIIPLYAIDMIIGIPVLSSIYMLTTLVPAIAFVVRRLHDAGKSGWWYFISMVPLVGVIWLLVLLCKKGKTNTRPAKAKTTDWIALAAVVAVSIIGFAVGINKIVKNFTHELTDMDTESIIIHESESGPEAPKGATLAGVSTDGNYWYYLKEGENTLYQIDKSTNNLYTINIEEAFDDIFIYSIEDYTVYGNKLVFITDNGATGSFAGYDAFYLDMDDETWHYIAFARVIQFIKNKTALETSDGQVYDLKHL